MRRLLLIFILAISFQTYSKADDIRNFEIEGITIGDSLLDFFSKNEIDKNLRNFYKNKNFLVTLLPTLRKDSMYEYIQVHFRKGDDKYIVYSIDGLIDIDIKECIKLQTEVVNSISDMFTNIKKDGPSTIKHQGDPSGKSTSIHFEWRFNNYDNIEVVCYDFVKPMEWPDGLNVAIAKRELLEWLVNDAYN